MDAAPSAHFSIEANGATYRRFGVVAEGGKLFVQYGDGSGFYVEACQENTTVCGSYNQAMPTGLAWHFHHWIYRGTAYIDDYREFSTTGLTWTPDERMTFSYDALDRLLVSQPAAEPGAQGYTQSFAYTEIGNFLAKNGVTQNYYDPAHKHAVTHLNNVQQFWYDANGNMTRRDEQVRFSSPFPP